MEDYVPASAACPLADGAMDALEAFKAAGLRQVILSASNLDTLRRQTDERGVTGYFDRLLGLDDIYAKSKVEVGLAYLKENGFDPARAVMIGDFPDVIGIKSRIPKLRQNGNITAGCGGFFQKSGRLVVIGLRFTESQVHLQRRNLHAHAPFIVYLYYRGVLQQMQRNASPSAPSCYRTDDCFIRYFLKFTL